MSSDCSRTNSFLPEPWTITETSVQPAAYDRNETVFCLGNGYMGLRGGFIEQACYGPEAPLRGFFINGVYEYSKDYQFIWKRPGYPRRSQSMLNLTDWNRITLEIDGQEFSLHAGQVHEYRRVLDMQRAVLTRQIDWTSPNGKRVRINIEKFLSAAQVHAGLIRVSVEAVDAPVQVQFVSVLQGRVRNWDFGQFVREVPATPKLKPIHQGSCGTVSYLTQQTPLSQFTVSVAASHVLHLPDGQCCRSGQDDRQADEVSSTFVADLPAGGQAVFDKYVAVFHRPDLDFIACEREALQLAETLPEAGFEQLRAEHETCWQAWWQVCDIEIDGDPALQQGIRFNMFHLLGSVGRDGRTNIGANGLTGEHYQGHVFWDTEMYMLPFFLNTDSDIARNLLIYRYSILDKARERARQMEEQGALYSWNSMNGEECGYIFEAATAQYHINNAIYYAIERYVEATGDEQFLFDYGAEMLFETARCMAHRGHFIPLRDNQFCINVICGPDEYTPLVDNNCYTNCMTKHHLDYAWRVAKMIAEKRPERFAQLCQATDLEQDELDLWRRASDNMYIPYHDGLGIHAQDDQFLYRDPVPVTSIPPERHGMLTKYHPLNLWRMQIAKQADVALLMIMQSNDFTLAQKRANYDYYEPRTIHDSSLSPSIHSILASEVGYLDDAYRYFMQSARMDLDDINGNTWLGVHTACMGGTWLAIVAGFGGLRRPEGRLHFNPWLPGKWGGYRFRVRYQGRLIEAQVQRDTTTYRLLEGAPYRIDSNDQPVELEPGKPVAVPNREVEQGISSARG